jgi:L-amino acid N-acyltransferase YncA
MPLIRLGVPDDGESVARIYAPYVADGPTSFEIEVPSAAEMARRIVETQATHPWLIYEESGLVGGYAYATKHRARSAYQWSCEVSVYVDPACRRRRIGQALYTSLFRILAAQGFANAYAGVTLPNDASVGLHESLGFEPIGVFRQIGFKLGEWHDVGWWQLALGVHAASPPAPQPLAAIAALQNFDVMLAAGLSLVRPIQTLGR